MIIPYLSFQGDCEEAITRYIEVLGGEILFLSRYTAETGGQALCGKVMHVEAQVGESVIAAGDREQAATITDAIRLMVHCDTMARAEHIMEAFGEGGEIRQRLLPHPPPDDGGVGGLVCDKYGYSWIITVPNERT